MNSQTPHPFRANPMRGRFAGQSNYNECADCAMPRTHRAHPQAARGALGHNGQDDYTTCYTESHWLRPVTRNEGMDEEASR